MQRLHATCVALSAGAVLIRGDSGAGKSDLALRLIDRGAALVADDQTELAARDDTLFAAPPAPIAGLLEVRGIGIVRFDHLSEAAVRLVVDLVSGDAVERMPKPRFTRLLGIALPLLRLDPSSPAAPAAVALALDVATGRRELV